ncbi:MAG: hypothetical protein ACI4XL_10170 [Bacillus sp. (in: firmicutes)]
MKQVINSAMKTRQYEKKRTAVLRLEMDYELATLYDAMKDNDFQQKKKSKQKLERIRRELMKLDVL